MKKQLVSTVTVILLMISACRFVGDMENVRGSGTTAREERAVQNVRGVTLATLGDLTIELGDEEALVIEAEDNLLPHLETDVRGGTLTIRSEPGVNLMPREPVRYYLTVKSLESLSVTSSGNIVAPALTAGTFKVESSSSGDIQVAGLDAERVDVEISSSGDVAIDSGHVERQEVKIHSSGIYMADDVQCERATVELTSSGNANIWATDSIDASLSSSGELRYYGDAEVKQSTTSSGKVVSLGDR